MRKDTPEVERSPPIFVVGQGEMAALIRDKDWSKTPLGPVETWPQSLRTTVSLCLASNFPINIIWGTGHTQIYNDGYRVVCGDAHPRALGEAYTETWASAWPAIGAPFERALKGETSFLENQRMFLFRNGYLEETFFTFSLSPIRDESGAIGGLFHPVTETTASMLAERRMRLLRDLNARISDARTTDEILRSALDVLAGFSLDLPFVALYRLHASGDFYEFFGQQGLQDGLALAPPSLSPRDADPWPLPQTAPILVTGLREKTFGSEKLVAREKNSANAPCGPYEEGPDAAFVLPIVAPGGGVPVVLAMTGVSARLPLDQTYRDFFGQLSAAVTAGIANARAYEVEQARVAALAQIDRAKTAFFSNVSHEFRTPLTLMLGPIEDALADTAANLPDIQRHRIDMARRNGVRMLKLVNTLLDFARIEAGRAEASFEPIDLAGATAELVSHFRSACETAGLRLTVDCPPLSQFVFVDRDMWEKIVLNLLSNAFKFTMEGGIDVRLRATPGEAVLEVSDTGVGIAPEEMPRLFERFHRIALSQGRTYEGTGIGLALVQELVSLHGGSINAESSGRGTTFRVAIPMGSAHLPVGMVRPTSGAPCAHLRARAFGEEALRWIPDKGENDCLERSEPGVKSIGHLGVRGRRPRILLADDNSDMRDYVSRILRDAGCDVDLASDGEAALAAIRSPDRPDLMVSDVMMPRLDGFGLLKKLRADASVASVPVILLSARAGEEARLEGLTAGADDYMVKPFSGRELVARVEGVLRLARLRQEKVEAERQILERALDMSEDRLSLVLDSARMGSWDWDIDADHLEWTPMCKAIFGLPADTPISFKIFLDLLHPEDRDRVDEICRDAIDPLIRARYDTQFRAIWPDGSVHWILSRGRVYFADERALRFIGAVIDVTEQKEAETRLRVLVNELSHRVKNTLAVVQSIAEQTFRSGTELGGVRQALAGRLQALADTHTLLTQSNWRSVDVAALVERSVGHLVQQGDGRFSSVGPSIGLQPKAALALGLVLHELGVNAMKHGAWSIEGGKVAAYWGLKDGKIEFAWRESGMSGLTPPTRRGFGSKIIGEAVAYDIAGEATQIWRPDGLQYVLTIPVRSRLPGYADVLSRQTV